MHRAILEACWPCAVALASAFVALTLLLRFCGATWRPAVIRKLHRCETGGVQSLSFVLTVPAFMMIVLFIIQVSQLMVGTMVVNYAAFAAARAAVVWIPADIGTSLVERENVLDGTVVQSSSAPNSLEMPVGAGNPNSIKYQKILGAAVLACAPISPSRDLQNSTSLPSWVTQAQDVMVALYPLLAPGSASNPRISQRLRNKLAYSYQNTFISIEWMEVPHPVADAEDGPSYNPHLHPDPNVPAWNPNEVGWEDPVTVTVTHRFALLPGPGRFLAARLVPSNGIPDRVSGTINTNRGEYTETVYSTNITASATLANDGIKSVFPHDQTY